MNRSLLPASMLLGAALFQPCAWSQPAAPDQTRTPTFSVAELEAFLGGRTLLDLDLKDATLEQVAAALSQASNQKIEARVTSSSTHYNANRKPIPTPLPLYSFSAAKTEFWPALRQAQLAARRVAQPADAVMAEVPTLKNFVLGAPRAPEDASKSLGLIKSASGWWLQTGSGLADGRAVEAWPFLLIANDLTRNQHGSLSANGMNESVIAAKPFDLATVLQSTTASPKAQAKSDAQVDAKTADAEHWSDRLTLAGKLLIDPKLNPLRLRYEVLEALDDRGNDLHLAGETAIRLEDLAAPSWIPFPPAMAPSGRAAKGTAAAWGAMPNPYAPSTGYSQPLQIAFSSRPGMGKKLVRLRGVLRFSVVSRSQHWETTQLDKPIDGTVFQNGGEFKVQFNGLQKTEAGWSAGVASQSRGPHLAAFFSNSIGGQFTMGSGGSRLPIMRRSVGVNMSGAADTEMLGFPSTLNFEGVPQMKLLDENGQVFEMTNGPSSAAMMHTVPGAAPIAVSSDKSPLPPDLAQNWSFDESRSFDFTPPTGALGAGVAMGRPVKLILDLPLERREVEIPFEFTNLPLPPS